MQGGPKNVNPLSDNVSAWRQTVKHDCVPHISDMHSKFILKNFSMFQCFISTWIEPRLKWNKIVLAAKTIWFHLLSSYTSSTCPYNMVNFGPLSAEILSLVWGTPANFNGFRVLASLLHGIYTVSQKRVPPYPWL